MKLEIIPQEFEDNLIVQNIIMVATNKIRVEAPGPITEVSQQENQPSINEDPENEV